MKHCLGYACTYMRVLVCVLAHRFSTWIALLQQKVIYESEFNKHVRMIYVHTHTHTNVCKCVCVRMQMRKYVAYNALYICMYVCMYGCVSGIYVCTNIRILLTEFAAAAAVAKQNTPQHTTHKTDRNTAQHNKTKRTATRSDPYAV